MSKIALELGKAQAVPEWDLGPEKSFWLLPAAIPPHKLAGAVTQ